MLRPSAVETGLSRTRIPEPDEALAFLELLWSLDHGLNLMSKRMLAKHGVTGPQRAVVRLVGRQPGLTPKEVAERAHQHPSTLSVILRKLEDSGHVVRVGDPDDHRRVRLFLSPSGREVDALREGTVEAAVRTALERLGPRQVGSARRALRVLVEELEKTVRDTHT